MHAHLEVEVRSGRLSGRPHETELTTGRDLLTDSHADCREVRVERAHSRAVPHDDQVSVPVGGSGPRDHTSRSRTNRRPRGSWKIDAWMEAVSARAKGTPKGSRDRP